MFFTADKMLVSSSTASSSPFSLWQSLKTMEHPLMVLKSLLVRAFWQKSFSHNRCSLEVVSAIPKSMASMVAPRAASSSTLHQLQPQRPWL
ncbi:unnamed protein product [Pseudo-nitzschia multistriata]|uniref:Uncharacterized protein n=1 Tax=Pseudo-nitzschia multistriata TaxID=183589 RepID=A0A448Z153_9STRA|nr:unnamed protein product [Pseudo-nitzschia multistriata]